MRLRASGLGYGQLMKTFCVALLVGTAFAACAATPRAGSEPHVPKKAIEKTADTTIKDGGPADATGNTDAPGPPTP